MVIRLEGSESQHEDRGRKARSCPGEMIMMINTKVMVGMKESE